MPQRTRIRGRGRTRDLASAPGRTLGLDTADVVKLAARLKEGLPYDALERLERRTGLSLDAIGRAAQLPRRTLARRKIQGTLTSQESERLYRLAVVFEAAAELFDGDVEAARHWLGSRNKALGLTPLEMCDTEVGAREVEDLIGRLQHGVFV